MRWIMRDFNTETELNDEKIAELSEQYKGTLGFLKKYLFEAERTSMEKLNREVPTLPTPCRYCSNHPSNGGSGVCHCTLGAMEIR